MALGEPRKVSGALASLPPARLITVQREEVQSVPFRGPPWHGHPLARSSQGPLQTFFGTIIYRALAREKPCHLIISWKRITLSACLFSS